MPMYYCSKCGSPFGASGATCDCRVDAITRPLTANDHQVGGSHYKTEGLPEHWDLVNLFGWDYFQGQITKYLMRWRKKNGLEDLEKARHYLDKYIEVERGKIRPATNQQAVGISAKQGDSQN